jgi:hypothetical protein
MSNLDMASYTRQGKSFFACTQTAGATTALSTTYTGLVVYNPWGSGKKLVLYYANWAFTTLPTGVGGVFLSTGNTPSVAATPSGTAATIWSSDGSGVNTIGAARAFTIATLPVVNVYVAPLAMCSTGTTVAMAMPAFPEGGFVVVPGNYVCVSHFTTVATGLATFAWVEVPQ